MQQTLRAGIVIGLFLTLAACGFHLRGLDQNGQIRPLAFSTLKIEATEAVDGRLLQQFKQRLVAQGVQLVASEAQAQAVLKLSATQFQRITTAKDGNGDVTAELLKLQQPFALIAVASGKTVVQGAAVSYRDRSIDPNALLAAERELASQKTLMRQEVVQQILQRLSEITPQKWQKMSESPVLPANQSTTPAQ
ncbi:LPS-assembly lipoprotein LptE [Galenea microaerophila]